MVVHANPSRQKNAITEKQMIIIPIYFVRKELALRYFDKDKRQKIIGERLVKKTQTWLEGLPVGTKKDY